MSKKYVGEIRFAAQSVNEVFPYNLTFLNIPDGTNCVCISAVRYNVNDASVAGVSISANVIVSGRTAIVYGYFNLPGDVAKAGDYRICIVVGTPSGDYKEEANILQEILP